MRKLYKAGVAAKEQFDQMQANADAQQAARPGGRSGRAGRRSFKWNTARSIRQQTDARALSQVYPGNLVKQNDVPILIVINQVSADFPGFLDPRAISRAVEKYMAKGTLQVEATPYGDTVAEIGHAYVRRQHGG